eukprot:COSAG05_NODE_3225_length_2226_cov_16.545369_1_plen_556_part_00
MTSQIAAAALVCLLLLAPPITESQSPFGPAPSSKKDTCPMAEYQKRANEVQRVCCPTTCKNSLPSACKLDCAIVFLDFYNDCQNLMKVLMGGTYPRVMAPFVMKCTRSADKKTMMKALVRMTKQGCSADAALEKDRNKVNGGGFGAASGAGHFAVEVGKCDFKMVPAKAKAVDRACCASLDSGDRCKNGVPTSCDIECAIHYVPFHEDCKAVLGGAYGERMQAHEDLYGKCMANSRRDASGLLRTMHLSNSAWNLQHDAKKVGSRADICPIESALNFFGNCPNGEAACIAKIIGADYDLASKNIYRYYRFKSLSTWGGNRNWCIYDISLRGPGNCVYDLRAMMTKQRHSYKDSKQVAKKMQGKHSWRHFTDSIAYCNANKVCSNTDSYGPHGLFDDPFGQTPAGSIYCAATSPFPHASGWVMVDMTKPTMITGYRITEYYNYNLPKEMLFEGSTDGKNWKTIEKRSTSQFPWINYHEDRMYWVGVPTGPSTYGIPRKQWEEFNANPFAFGAKDSTAQEIRAPRGGTQHTAVCALGAGARDKNMHRGKAAHASGKH